MAAKFNIPRCGDVEIYHGLMGAGKSYMAVREVVRIITEERRPVFTNLPIRWPVMRQFLRNRGGKPLANMIFPMTEKHFRAFVKRQGDRLTYRDEMRAECQQEGRQFRESAFKRRWLEHAGPDIMRGPDAQWVAPLAVLVIDEVHHWFPSTQQQQNKEFLQGYLTMLRHHLQRLVVISQNPMQADISFRRLASTYMEIKQQGEEGIAWGLRFKHFGVRGIAFVQMTKEAAEDNGPGSRNVRPIKSGLVFEKLPMNRWVFRLYDSFTHVGGVRQMMKTLREVRREAGLSEDGVDEMAEVVKRVYRWKPALFASLLVFPVGVMVGGQERAKRDAVVDAVAAAEVEVAAQEHVPLAGSMAGIVGSAVVVDDRVIEQGEVWDGYTLAVVRDGFTVWASDQRVYRWEPGREPVDLGTPAEVGREIAKRFGGGTVGSGSPVYSGTVGAAGRDGANDGTGGGGDGG